MGYKEFDFKIKKRKVALSLKDQFKLEGEYYNNPLEIAIMDKYDSFAPGNNLKNLGKPIVYYKDSDGNIVNNLKVLPEGEYDIVIDHFIEGDNNYEIFFNNAKLYVYCNKPDENGEDNSSILGGNKENSGSISDLNVETDDSVDITEYLLVSLLSFILIVFLMRKKKLGFKILKITLFKALFLYCILKICLMFFRFGPCYLSSSLI